MMRKAENPLKTRNSSLALLALAIAMLVNTLCPLVQANAKAFEIPANHTVLTQNSEFDRSELFAPDYRPSNTVSGFSFMNPNRFSMNQSYSVNFASGSMGSSSAGLYLNTLSYKLADPLVLSADVGFYSPLYSSTPGSFGSKGMQDPTQGSTFVLPRLGLEYKPTKNTTFSVHLFNGQDAVKAYGYSNPFLNPWTR
jgi:hypothetical protein